MNFLSRMYGYYKLLSIEEKSIFMVFMVFLILGGIYTIMDFIYH